MPLEYDNGDRMRDQNTPQTDVKTAYHRIMAAPVVPPEDGQDVSVLQVCLAYLATVEDSGAPSTFISRQNTLFEFCYGLPSRFISEMAKSRRNRSQATTPMTASDRYGFQSYFRSTWTSGCRLIPAGRAGGGLVFKP